MNFPRVRITPLGPAPYWKIETAPNTDIQSKSNRPVIVCGMHTADEAHDHADG
jgi:hypothetical protein